MVQTPQKLSSLAGAALRDLWPVALATLLIWVFLPGVFFSNLHTDTLEAAYWGRDLAFGYEKHPPLLSWLIRLALVPGPFAITSLLLLSFGFALATALFIYMALADHASRPTARWGATLALLASPATFYALQLNHNSALEPFLAASLFFGWRYITFERQRDVTAFGIVFALGILTKYEIILVIPALVGLAIYEAKFLALLRRPAFWGAALLALGLIAPHLAWLNDNEWSSLSRATGSAAIKNPLDLLFSLWGGIIGLVAAIGLPVITAVVMTRSTAKVNSPSDHQRRIKSVAQILFFAPLAGIIILTLGTLQYIKALWMLPLMPTCLVGLTLWCDARYDLSHMTEASIRRAGLIATTAMAIFYTLYLAAGLFIDNPLESYLADTKTLTRKAEKFWNGHVSSPLACVITDELKIGPAALLWLRSSPMILPLNSAKWSTDKRLAPCRETGGIALMIDPDKRLSLAKRFPTACTKNSFIYGIGTPFTGKKLFWEAEVILIPPASSDCARLFDNQTPID